MSFKSRYRTSNLVRLACLALMLLGLHAAAAPASAEEATAPVPSLKLVPQDAAFYSSMLRVREQVEIVANSNFWKQMNDMEFVKQMRQQFEMAKSQPHNPLSGFFKALEMPENKQALEVVCDMFSEEVFFYGGPDLGDAMLVLSGASNAARFEKIMQEISGAPHHERAVGGARAMFDALNEDLDAIKVPELVLAMRVKNKEAAEEQLRRLEGYARIIPEHEPKLARLRGKFKTQKVGDSQFLTLTVDDKLIPWDEVPFDKIAEQPGQYDKLRDKLKSLKMVVALGLHQDYVVLSIGKSLDHLAAWGKGPALLDHPKMKVVRDKGAQRFTSVTYVSQQLAETTGFHAKDMDGVVELVQSLLVECELPADDQKQIMTDVRQVADAIKPDLPKYDAQVGFGYLTPRGIESYSYDWTQSAYRDGSKLLPVLSHLGANPLLALAKRGKHRPQDYDLVATVLTKGRDYFEKYGLPEMDRWEKANYKQFADIAYPLLARADKVNRELLLPALADGQSALVIDGSLKAKKWLEQMPATTEETAIPMPALVLGVSDPAKLDKALGEYRLIANELMAKLRPLAPNVPEIQLPPAEQKKQPDGSTVYYYPLADKIGVNKQLAPNAGLSEKFLVLSLSPRLTVSLLKSQKLAAAGDGPLASAVDRPLAGAAVFDFPQLVDTALPWINEATREYVRQMERAFAFNAGEEEEDGAAPVEEKPLVDTPAMLATLAQVKQFCDLLKVLHGVTSVTYVEDGAKITHREIRIEDVR